MFIFEAPAWLGPGKYYAGQIEPCVYLPLTTFIRAAAFFCEFITCADGLSRKIP